MVDLEGERLLTNARSTLEELASHLSNLAVLPMPASALDASQSGSGTAAPIAHAEWSVLTGTVGWKSGPSGFFTGLEWYRNLLAAAAS